MGISKTAEKVMLVIPVFYGKDLYYQKAKRLLIDLFGELLELTDLSLFNLTSYYELLMGTLLKVRYLAFKEKISPVILSIIKNKTNLLLKILASLFKLVLRPVNLDPGYLTRLKFVLATTKNRCHRIYIGDGIYAESTLYFYEGNYKAWDWTYQSYKKNTIILFLNKMRTKI